MNLLLGTLELRFHGILLRSCANIIPKPNLNDTIALSGSQVLMWSFEMQEHLRNPDVELEELTQIYVNRGLTYYLAKQVIFRVL